MSDNYTIDYHGCGCTSPCDCNHWYLHSGTRLEKTFRTEREAKDYVSSLTTVPRDMKWDTGKPDVYQMIYDFPKALLAVSAVTSYGIRKYNQPGSWKHVDEAYKRYSAALGRHLLLAQYEDIDPESGHPHLAHAAWNALAILELYLENEEV